MVRLGPIKVVLKEQLPSDHQWHPSRDHLLVDVATSETLNQIADAVLDGVGINLICSDFEYGNSIAQLIRTKCEEYIHGGLFKGPCGYNAAVCCHQFENGQCAMPF